jgi:uncharacterized membrane protein YjgN (DUF898 family)
MHSSNQGEIASTHRERRGEMTIETTISYAVIAIVAALALLGVVVITIVTIPIQLQQAEAAGCNNGRAFNASHGRCFGH